ncbi:ribosomal protein L7/L12 [Streptomyces mirabilis]|uniref:LSU ribosomal protein L12P homologue n=1 Tax=Streptomyces mirabilis TaxID=68239 RepID=A0A1I2R8B4_9ACTN|nr:ribosomal protein L7/L12 [Streptomyces mirabilis]SFG34837.1 LSU ribosomal protein L12P homologue [Streptomyces mirabilis]
MGTLGFFVLAMIVFACYAGLEGRLSRNDRKIARVEKKLDRILDHLGLAEADPELEQVAALAHDGRKIQAIKVYREVTGAGLKEAKDAVDRLV